MIIPIYVIRQLFAAVFICTRSIFAGTQWLWMQMKVWYSCNHCAHVILNSVWSTQGRMQCWSIDPTEPNFVFFLFLVLLPAVVILVVNTPFSRCLTAARHMLLSQRKWKTWEEQCLKRAAATAHFVLVRLRFCIPSCAEAMLSVVWPRASSCGEPSEVLLEWCFPAVLAHCWTLPLFVCHSHMKPTR